KTAGGAHGPPEGDGRSRTRSRRVLAAEAPAAPGVPCAGGSATASALGGVVLAGWEPHEEPVDDVDATSPWGGRGRGRRRGAGLGDGVERRRRPARRAS